MPNEGPGSASASDMGMLGCPCNTCARVYPGMDFCEAFPDGEGIPATIITGRDNHLTETAGDHGLRYVYGGPKMGPKPRWAP